MRAAYFKGCHLWEHWDDWGPQAQRTGDSRHMGVAQVWGYTEPGSPNFQREIPVKTYIEPMTGTADLDPETSLDTLLVQIEDELVSLSKTKGALAYAMDSDQKADVTGGPYAAAGVITHGAVGGSWTPAIGHLVLVRKPTTGAGFCCSISAVSAGVSMTLAALTNQTWESIDSTWDIVYVQQVFTLTSFEHMNRGSRVDSLAGKAHRRDVEYIFSNHAPADHAAVHAIPRGNA